MIALRRRREGTTAVELAAVLPVFLTFMFGLVEYGRVQLTANVLKNASRQAARYGATEGISTSAAISRASEILASVMDLETVDIMVKDASSYDGGGAMPSEESEYSGLPDLELSAAEPRQLFVIRASVTYNDMGWLPLACFDGLVLTGQSFMRHE